MILAMALGPSMEENLRRWLLLSDGDVTVFITRLVSGGFMGATGVLLLLFMLPASRKKRKEVITEQGQAR